MYRVSRLENGLVVATAAMPHMASISVGIWVAVGGRYESSELSGVSHFIEHLLFKGTRRRSAKQISQDVEGLGGELNAFTSEENTCFFSKARHDRFDDLLDVLMDMFLNSVFAPGEIHKERAVIKEELAMYRDQPQQYVQEMLNELLWPNHPLGRALTGTEETLDAMQRSDIVRYLQSHYVAGNTLVTAAGCLDHDAVVRTVSRYARHFKPGGRSNFMGAPNGAPGPRLRLLTKTTEQTQIALGMRACSRHDERRFALRLLNTLLGENMSSRLFQVVREDHGLAYSIGSSIGLFDDVGALTISAGVETDKLAAALKLIMRETARFASALPSVAELRRARDYLIGQMDLGLEHTSNQMMWIGEQLLGYGKIIPPEEIKERLYRVKPAAIRAVAQDVFQAERFNLALISPLKKEPGLASLLRN